MPIYEYHCEQCDHEFEKLVFNSSEKISCPGCKGKKVKRLMSACAFSIGGTFKSTAGASACGTCSTGNCTSCGSK
jgi:putative FmdB family regulatory protein